MKHALFIICLWTFAAAVTLGVTDSHIFAYLLPVFLTCMLATLAAVQDARHAHE